MPVPLGVIKSIRIFIISITLLRSAARQNPLRNKLKIFAIWYIPNIKKLLFRELWNPWDWGRKIEVRVVEAKHYVETKNRCIVRK